MTEQDPGQLDPRIVAYLRSRANVEAPRNLLTEAMAEGARRGTEARWWQRPWRLGATLASAAAILVVVAVVGVGLWSSPMPATPGPSALAPTSSAPASAGPVTPSGGPVTPSTSPEVTTKPSGSPAVFPATVAGMPVISVAQAVELLNQGKLDGRAVAVAGYFAQQFLPCPMPMRYMAPLEDWCRAVAFTDDPTPPWQCTGNSCSWSPSTPDLSPYVMSDTVGLEVLDYSGGSQALVLIGHTDDPRQWQCPPDARSQCAGDFVVDRVAWAGGETVDLQPPATDLTTRMTLADLAASTGAGDGLISAAAFTASDALDIDPRFYLAGDDTVWVVRSLQDGASAAPADPTRAVDVWLIDDATGAVLARTDLAMSPSYRPAQLSISATRTHVPDNDLTYPFYRAGSSDGLRAHESRVGGSEMTTGDGLTTYGPGLATVLDPGDYALSAWLAATDTNGNQIGDVIGSGCSDSIHLNALDDVTLQAAFAADGSCTWGPAPAQGPF